MGMPSLLKWALSRVHVDGCYHKRILVNKMLECYAKVLWLFDGSCRVHWQWWKQTYCKQCRCCNRTNSVVCHINELPVFSTATWVARELVPQGGASVQGGAKCTKKQNGELISCCTRLTCSEISKSNCRFARSFTSIPKLLGPQGPRVDRPAKTWRWPSCSALIEPRGCIWLKKWPLSE